VGEQGIWKEGRGWSIPGKVFLVGEYAVLAGLPVWGLACGPRFRLEASADALSPGRVLHPESPAGRLLADRGLSSPGAAGWSFLDSHGGAGGFGGSTAEFALLAAALGAAPATDEGWLPLWRSYRALTRPADGSVPPSGADLVTQWLGGTVRFRNPGGSNGSGAGVGVASGDEQAEAARVPAPALESGQLLVFSAAGQAGRKVATHRHLAELRADGRLRPESGLMRQLATLLERVPAALGETSGSGLGALFDEWARAMKEHSLEIEATREDREALRRLPGVLGVKGAGALQADCLLVLCKPVAGMQNEVLRVAASRGLTQVLPANEVS
jgi:hypothetical protein